MPAIRRKLLIEQGATGPDNGLFTWQNPRTVFKAVAPTTGTGLSDTAEPSWPDTGCDCDEIVDNEVTWHCERQATSSDWNNLKLWCPSTAYAKNDLIIVPKVPIDLTGYTARMQIRTEEADSTNSEILFALTSTADVDGNVILLGGVAGTIEIIIQAGTTETFEWDEGEYDLELMSGPTATYPVGFVRRLLEGVVVVSKERTRT